jgi:MFS family permease
MVAVGWHLYEIANSVVSLGLIGLAKLAPYFALALYSGHAVDHYSRKWIAAIACLIHIAVGLFLTCIALGLAFSTSPIDLHRRCIYWCWTSSFKAILSSTVWPDHSKRSAASIHSLCIFRVSDLCSGWSKDWEDS